MDQSLNAQVKLDVASDVIRIDVRGRLSQTSRPALMQLIQRIRRMGISSHIRVDLANAEFVESAALAGLRNDLNAIDSGSGQLEVAGALTVAAGVSLELQMFGDDFGRVFQPLDVSGDFRASIDSSGTRPLARLLRRRTAGCQRLRLRQARRPRHGCAVGAAGPVRRHQPGNHPPRGRPRVRTGLGRRSPLLAVDSAVTPRFRLRVRSDYGRGVPRETEANDGRGPSRPRPAYSGTPPS